MNRKEAAMLQSEQDRLNAFIYLRGVVHQEMEQRMNARLAAGINRPSDLELELDAYEEELEPQVLDAVKIFNAKGYKTVSSGFYGEHGEYQCIDGPFNIDGSTTQKLAEIGVGVVHYSERYGVEGSMVTFYPQEPDLEQITATWRQVATLLPERGRR
jgi:hypothetical protein